ncbi:MAG: site-specific DNA-methyltransferase [Caldisericales bacterium]|jgi:adenine-specific DNA-methyltransferase|nr:site-specific DNA-methyltransferase [Caldisericales bacterium]
MPTLQFKGKNIIWNHHLAVPFHTLDEVPELHYLPEKANGNMIIEGDNLIALKALLPQFAGKIKCIYIDPPYNTGNEGWIYNDKVNSPLINEWIGKTVGIDDLTRHDKWLCMMVPRLKLLRELLSEDGVIFISIDDNELYNLKNILDEIFTENGFISNITVQVNKGGRDYLPIAETHENLLCYFKTEKSELNELAKKDMHFSYTDSYGDYNHRELRNRNPKFTSANRPNLFYPIYVNESSENEKKECLISLIKTNEFNIEVFPLNSEGNESCWRWSKDKLQQNIKETIDLSNVIAKKKNGGGYNIYEKHRKDTSKAKSIWDESEVRTEQGTIDLRELNLGGKFEHPKPTPLIKKIIELATLEDSIILDSFAGSGTTMHAVMDLNKEDGGNRRCIMVQMTEATEAEPDKNICKDITRERVKRAIDKYRYDAGFKYYRLGIPLDAETMLAGQLPTYNQFAKYVYYLCTGEHLEAEDNINEADYYVGEYGKQAIYLVYKQDYETLTRLALNLTLAEKIKQQQPGKKRIVYAPSCFLDEEYLTDNQFEYVGIPYNLFQHNQ